MHQKTNTTILLKSAGSKQRDTCKGLRPYVSVKDKICNHPLLYSLSAASTAHSVEAGVTWHISLRGACCPTRLDQILDLSVFNFCFPNFNGREDNVNRRSFHRSFVKCHLAFLKLVLKAHALLDSC